MKLNASHTLQTPENYTARMLPKRRGYIIGSGSTDTKPSLHALQLIHKFLLFINLLIMNACLLSAYNCTSQVMLVSTALLAALASALGVYTLSRSSAHDNVSDSFQLATFHVYASFLTIVAASISMLSIMGG